LPFIIQIIIIIEKFKRLACDGFMNILFFYITVMSFLLRKIAKTALKPIYGTKHF
jgi:hypothetical protein